MTIPLIHIVAYDMWDHTTALLETHEYGHESDWPGIFERACELYRHQATSCDSPEPALFVCDHPPAAYYDGGGDHFTVTRVYSDDLAEPLAFVADGPRQAAHGWFVYRELGCD